MRTVLGGQRRELQEKEAAAGAGARMGEFWPVVAGRPIESEGCFCVLLSASEWWRPWTLALAWAAA